MPSERGRPNEVRYHLKQSGHPWQWTPGKIVLAWNSSWGSATCLRFSEGPSEERLHGRLSVDSVEVAVDTLERRCTGAENRTSGGRCSWWHSNLWTRAAPSHDRAPCRPHGGVCDP